MGGRVCSFVLRSLIPGNESSPVRSPWWRGASPYYLFGLTGKSSSTITITIT